VKPYLLIEAPPSPKELERKWRIKMKFGSQLLPCRSAAGGSVKPSLGAKWPVADYAVELVDSPGKFFLVQVKATRAVVSASGRIRVSASEDHVRLLLAAPVPAFIAAVDEPNERVFIVRPKKAQRLQSVGTSFLLNDPAVRVKLRDEVASFWNAVSPIMAQYQSAFLDK